VVIHCGDLTENSQLSEFETTLQLLRDIDAPLKLVIPGNHEFTLDTPTFQQMCHKSRRRCNRELLQHYYGSPGEAKALFTEAARRHGITYLEEGTHRFSLPNGASLTVYASPYTPAFGSPGFQYNPKLEGHDFAIPQGVDVAITHGPPRGVLDRSWVTGENVGSVELFAAIARARPRLHCFGHIHEGWGAEVVTWGDVPVPEDAGSHHGTSTSNSGEQSSTTTSATGRSTTTTEGRRRSSTSSSWTLLADLGSLLPLKGDTMDLVREKERKLAEYARGKCVKTSHCAGDVLPLSEQGARTLFVNAAVLGTPMRPPWVVDMELPRA
jgi:hypothetical protein